MFMKHTRVLKRGVSLILSLVLTVPLLCGRILPAELFGMTVFAEDEKPAEEKEGDITISNDWYGPYQAVYNDNMFLKKTEAESTDLAKLGIVLANAAYDESKIAELYQKMGFSCATYNYEKRETYDDNDFVGYALGYKEIAGNRVFLVSIRGTHSDCDWFSNFNLGTGDAHQGFHLAAGKLMNDLEEYLALYSASDSSKHNIIYFTGHSRGAAVANILAQWFSSGEYDNFNEKNVFAYTFATPNVRRGADKSLKNIYNYINPGDKVPAMPLSEWGFERNGQTYVLNTEGDTFRNFQIKFHKQYEAEEKYNEYYGGDTDNVSFCTLIYSLVPDQETYQKKKYIFDLIAAIMAKDDDYNAPADHSLLYLLGRVLNDTKGVFSEVQVTTILDSVTYGLYSDISASADVASYLAVCFVELDRKYSEVLEARENAELAHKACLAAMEEAKKEEREFNFNDWSRGWSKELGAASYLSNQSIQSIDDLVRAIQILKTLELKLISVKEDDQNAFRILGELLADLGNDNDENYISAVFRSIEHTHLPLTYYLWINSMYFGINGWSGYDGVIEKFVIPEKITRINYSCFDNCIGIKEFVIPDSVVNLSSAFNECRGLRYLTIPIDRSYDSSFYNSQLLTLHFTYGKTGIMPDFKMGPDPYYNEPGLQHNNGDSLVTVTFDDRITHIGKDAFYGLNGLINLKLPASLQDVGNRAFYQCTALESVELPEKVTSLGEECFAECVSLKTINLHDNITEIGTKCFSNDALLQIDPHLPEHLVSLGESAFDGCSSLCSEIVIPESLENYGSYIFSCTPITKITCPCDLKSSFSYGIESQITEIIYTKGKTGVIPSNRIWWNHVSLQKVTLSEGITKLEREAFKEAAVPTFILPSTLTEIGDYAFANCTNLTAITLPKNLRTLGCDAFSNSGLTSVTLPGSLVYEGTDEKDAKPIVNWFSNCTALKSVQLSRALNAIPSGAFSGCTALTKIDIPEGVKTIESSAFSNCSALTSVTFPDTLISIGAESFASCPLLTEITIPKSVQFISYAAFNNYYAEEKCVGRNVYIYNPDCDMIHEKSDFSVFNSGETIHGYSNSSARNAANYYGLTFVPLDPAYTVGDVNADGEITIADAVALSRCVNKWDGISIDLRAADLNQDQAINVLDAMILARAVSNWSGYDRYLILVPQEEVNVQT